MLKSKTKVNVAGKDFTIVSDESGEYVNRVAYFLNERYDEIRREYSGFHPVDMLTLAALNTADDLFKAREHIDELSGEITRMKEALQQAQIESRLKNKSYPTNTALENEIKALREEIIALQEENNELKNSGKISSFNKSAKSR